MLRCGRNAGVFVVENSSNAFQGRPPAGGRAGAAAHATPVGGGQQPGTDFPGLVIESERDRRTLDWLLAQVGAEGVQTALGGLSGGRRGYVSNLCRILGLRPPEQLERASADTARRHLAELQKLMGRGG